MQMKMRVVVEVKHHEHDKHRVTDVNGGSEPRENCDVGIYPKSTPMRLSARLPSDNGHVGGRKLIFR